MNWVEYLYDQISIHISVDYLLVFMFLSYTVKKHFEHLLQKITKSNWKTVYSVFLIASIIAIPFLIWSDESWVKIGVSYAVGTSMYELLFEFLEPKIKKK